jgi:dCMP deaminase
MERTDLSPIYNLRQNFIIIGLTGRTGSGCSSVAKILSNKTFKSCKFAEPNYHNSISNDERKDIILYNFLQSNWVEFKVINVTDIIVSTLFEYDFKEISNYISKTFSNEEHSIDDIIKDFKKLEADFNILKKIYIDYRIENERSIRDKKVTKVYFNSTINKFTTQLRLVTSSYRSQDNATVLQTLGTNLRSSGKAIEFLNSTDHVYEISIRINELVQAIRHTNDRIAHIVIDSLRNSIESMYFKERYSSYYLVAINAENDYRYNRLNVKSKLTKEQVDFIDKIEYTTKRGIEKFITQDIQSCIQNADIYMHNPTDDTPGDTYKTLKRQIIKYLSLILHPGIVTPSPVERCMQIAYTAKYNSGCISRQIGAVVSDSSFSIKSIGWNNTPEGQVPCLLRCVNDLMVDDKLAFSDYELDESFKTETELNYGNIDKTILKGRNVSFCFKDLQNSIDSDKNQVHTRALHAEENTFLQLSKYGSEGIKGGYLFTTASPCELCSKKAYQLSITRIYYIDPYPGIAKEHILKSGMKEKRPVLRLFKGAIGRAYHQLYHPFVPYKDELQMITGIKLIDKRKKELEKFKNMSKEQANEIESLKKIIAKNRKSAANKP